MEEKFKPIVCKSFFKSKFYQDITANGEVIFSAETPDDLLRQRYEKFAKGHLLKSAIPDELKNEEAYSFFHKKMKMITTGYRLNGSVLLDFYKDNRHFALVFFENKGIAKIGRCSNDIGLYCLTSENFKQRYSFSDRFINFFEIQLDNFWSKELLDPVKLCRNSRGFNKSLAGNKNLVRHLYFAIQHVFAFKALNKQERSILKCIGQYKGQDPTYIDSLAFVLKLRSVPYLTEKVYKYRKFAEIYFYYRWEDLVNFATSKEIDFFNNHYSEIEGYNDISLSQRHINHLLLLNTEDFKEIRRLSLEHISYFQIPSYLHYISKLSKEQISNSLFEFYLLLLVKLLRCKTPTNLTLYAQKVKPLLEKEHFEASWYKKRKIVNTTIQNIRKEIWDYFLWILGNYRMVDNIRSFNLLENLFYSVVREHSLIEILKESHTFHERYPQLERNKELAILKYNKPKIAQEYTYTAPTLLPLSSIDGVAIKQLCTKAELQTESDYMEHCVSGYVHYVLSGSSIIYHIGDFVSDMKEQSTVEFQYQNGEFLIMQHQTLKNNRFYPPSESHQQVVLQLKAELDNVYGEVFDKGFNEKKSREYLYWNVAPPIYQSEDHIFYDDIAVILEPIKNLSIVKKFCKTFEENKAKFIAE